AEPHFASPVFPDWLHWFLSRLGFSLMTVGAFMAIFQRRRIADYVEASDQIAAEAQDRLIQSEARFRQLVESTSNGVFCYSFDPPIPTTLPVEDQLQAISGGELTECNRLYANDLGFESPAEVLGSRFRDHSPTEDRESFRDVFRDFITRDYVLSDYDVEYRTPEGEDRANRVTLTGVVTNRRLLRIWGAETSILSWRRLETALERRRAYQELLARVSSQLVTTPMEEADALVVSCLEDVCRFIGADRSVIAWIDWETGRAEIDYAYTYTDVELQPTVSMREYPYIAKNLINNRVTLIEDIESPPSGASRDYEGLAALGVRSFVSVPLVVSNEVVGSVTFGNGEKLKFWRHDDFIKDLRFFAELFANYVLRIRSRKELDGAMEGLRRATERLEAENVYLRKEVELSHGFDEIIGESTAIRRCLHMVERVADTETPVLVLGETGTGKELIARALHDRSRRRDRPLVKVNCAALPGNLIESELFGYEKGAFTGANAAKRGRFDLADGSTLFLDEIGEIPIELQPKLLRVLQEGEFERLGGTQTIRVDVRIIAATNRDLADRVAEGEFRSDLYYRINTFPIELPALRDRGDDIQLLAEHFVKIHSQRLEREVTAISAGMMHELKKYQWPGNIRELEGVIQRALISSTGPVLELADPIAADADPARNIKPDLRSVERDHILTVLEDANWKIAGKAGAAARLGVPPSTLRSKMKKLQIARPA
ncbi:MAG: sigma 54-interacting transcriptional regulator, partial [Woeseiaceae bacterium]|nr:sigma 54-interacting transcriptional regulator [Woeseiaceae bacterium]